MTAEISYRGVSRMRFFEHFDRARRESEQVRGATSPFESSEGARYFLAGDDRSGFVIRKDGELTNVFSLERGRGDDMVSIAVNWAGATHLDCFDGYLTALYARHGFVEYAREPNWAPGGPDVVYMQQPDRRPARRHSL